MNADVLIGERRVGTFNQVGARLSFAYAEGWREDESTYPISYSLPKQVASHAGRVVENCLWGLLPDNAEVLKAWGRRFHISPRNPLALLLGAGDDCAGALRFAHPGECARTESAIKWLNHKQLCDRLQGLMEQGADGRHDDDGGYFSLPGAQRKTALRYDANKDRWGIPLGLEPTTHILKPEMPEYPHQVWNENFCLNLASAIGLPAARSWVLKIDGSDVLVVERFDRDLEAGTDRVARVHQEDLCQGLGVHPDQKYENDGGPGAPQIFQLLGETSLPEHDRERFIRAVLFNVLIGGSDAHVKNYSLLWGEGPYLTLAPLYDVNSIWPYVRPYGAKYDRQKIKAAMRLGRKYRFDMMMRRDIDRMAISCLQPPKLFQAWMDDVIELMEVELDDVCQQSLIAGAPADYMASLVDAIRDQIMRWRSN